LLVKVNLGDVLEKVLKDSQLKFEDHDNVIYTGKRLLLGQAGNTWTWTAVRRPYPNVPLPIYSPHFFQKDMETEEEEYFCKGKHVTGVTDNYNRAVEGATNPPFRCFQRYGNVDQGGVQLNSARKKDAFRMLVSFVRFVFLLHGETEGIFREDPGTATILRAEKESLVKAILAMREHGKYPRRNLEMET